MGAQSTWLILLAAPLSLGAGVYAGAGVVSIHRAIGGENDTQRSVLRHALCGSALALPFFALLPTQSLTLAQILCQIALIYMLLRLCMQDWYTMSVLDIDLRPLWPIGALAVLVSKDPHAAGLSVMIGLIVLSVLLSLTWAARRVAGRKSVQMGDGDVYLLMLLTFFLGPNILIATAGAAILGPIIAHAHRRTSASIAQSSDLTPYYPMVPSIALATLIVLWAPLPEWLDMTAMCTTIAHHLIGLFAR